MISSKVISVGAGSVGAAIDFAPSMLGTFSLYPTFTRCAVELRVQGETGGEAGFVSYTGVANIAANSTGVGSIKMKGATARDSAGFIKIYIGTTAYYLPAFSAITG